MKYDDEIKNLELKLSELKHKQVAFKEEYTPSQQLADILIDIVKDRNLFAGSLDSSLKDTWEQEERDAATKNVGKKIKNTFTVWELPLHKTFLAISEMLIVENNNIEYWDKVFKALTTSGIRLTF